MITKEERNVFWYECPQCKTRVKGDDGLGDLLKCSKCDSVMTKKEPATKKREVITK